jgi:CBS domain containing-hemolysin-like protein
MFELFKRFMRKWHPPKSEEEIKEVIVKGEKEGIITKIEEKMIKSVFDVGDTEIEEVMIPRVDMVSAGVDSNIQTVANLMAKTGFSKIPVYENTVDNIIGVAHAKDILRLKEKSRSLPVIEIVRFPYFLPSNKSVLASMKELQDNRLSIAMVVDEYGGVCGLITMEDLVEEIVGELRDEFDKEERLYRRMRDGSYILNARIELDKLNEILNTNFGDEDVNTLAGLILKRLERIPEQGEVCKIDGLEIKILSATEQRIFRVIVRKGAHELQKSQ